jgi:hypothetical protein
MCQIDFTRSLLFSILSRTLASFLLPYPCFTGLLQRSTDAHLWKRSDWIRSCVLIYMDRIPVSLSLFSVPDDTDSSGIFTETLTGLSTVRAYGDQV